MFKVAVEVADFELLLTDLLLLLLLISLLTLSSGSGCQCLQDLQLFELLDFEPLDFELLDFEPLDLEPSLLANRLSSSGDELLVMKLCLSDA